jgi:hypothetical protein
MTPRKAISRFDARLLQWTQLDAMACEAEARLEEELDRYCEGMGPAPASREVAFSRDLRRAANSGFSRLLDCVQRARRAVPLI